MLVFQSQKLVFLSVPKTGTTAIMNSLRPKASSIFKSPPGVKHTNLHKYQKMLAPFFESPTEPFETIAVIREPLSWLGSWYRYRRRVDLIGHPNSTANVSFDEFVMAYLEPNRPAHAQVGDQARFVKPKNGHAPITHLFQYEQIDLLINFLENRFDEKITLEKRNVSPKIELDIEPSTLKLLQQKCADQFDIWQSAKR